MKSKLIVFSSFSALLYGFWGTLITISLRLGTNPATIGLFIYFISSVISFPFLINKFVLPKKEWVVSGLLFASANYLLFSIIKLSFLSSAYVFVPSSILIFFIISIKRNKPKGKDVVRLSAAILLITAGMAISQVNGSSKINFFDLGLGLIIALFYGISSYLTAYSSSQGLEMLETFWIVLFENVVFLPLAILTGLKFTLGSFAVDVLAAFCVSFGLYLELASYNISVLLGDKFRLMNLINVLTNLDSVFIAVASVLLGSFTRFSLVGLVLVFLGAGFFFR
ncbi:MAG: hypothetical protein RAK20_02990 [Conexivisphaerales archaeon]|nr:hypothetical protein [Conexivisphaerales archaeon]